MELLTLVRHPAVPRLHDSGHWQHPSGACYPYLVMQCKDSGYLYQGGCYLPVAEPTKAPVASSVNDSAQP